MNEPNITQKKSFVMEIEPVITLRLQIANGNDL